jgi:zinc protease
MIVKNSDSDLITKRRSTMRMWIITLLLLLLPAGALPAVQPESFTVGGLKVIYVSNPATQIVSANMYFRGGVALASMENAGIEHLALVVAVRATKNYPREAMNAALDRMDTRINAGAGPDYSTISMRCVKKNLAESWKIFTDVILNPSFDSAMVELEREQTLAAIRQMQDAPDQQLTRLALESFYRETPYTVDPLGTERTVRSFSAKELQAYMQSRVSATQLLLVVCGNVTRAELDEMVNGSFGSLPQGSFQAPQPVPVRHTTPTVLVVKRPLPTNYILGLFPAPPIGTDASYAMTLGASILSDRVFEEVRTKRSLSYAAMAMGGPNFSSYRGIYTTTVKPETTITVMVDEIKKLQNEPVSAKSLKDKRNVYVTGYYLNVETNASQANMLAHYELSGAGYQKATKLMENISKVTAEEIQKVCSEYIHNLQFVLIGNPASLQLSPFMF